MLALPQAAYFLLLEAAVGGIIALFWVHIRGEVSRGFTLFTGICLLISGILAVWLHASFPPVTVDTLLYALDRTLGVAFVVLLALYLLALRIRPTASLVRAVAKIIPLLGLVWLWCAALVNASPQLFGLGTPLAVLAGAMSLGGALSGLSLGHWYLVSPSLSVRPLVRLTFVCLGALIAQAILLPILIFGPGTSQEQRDLLFGEYALFLGVRVIFGIVVPLGTAFLTWRTARIRSLDSATGLLYIVAALVLAGEIAARTLFFLTGVAT